VLPPVPKAWSTVRAEWGERGEGTSRGGVTVNSWSSSTSMLTSGGGMGSGGSIEVGDAGDLQEGFPEASDIRGLRGYSLLLPSRFVYMGRGSPSDASGGRRLVAAEQTPDLLVPRCHRLRNNPST
jgi:hypothetical protein